MKITDKERVKYLVRNIRKIFSDDEDSFYTLRLPGESKSKLQAIDAAIKAERKKVKR